MALRTSKEYREALKKMKPVVYIDGELVEDFSSHPALQSGIGTISLTYDLAFDPEYKDLLVTKSHLDGQLVSRFSHIHQSVDDLVKKVELTRKLCNLTGGCVSRCMGVDALNAIATIAPRIDKDCGTSYTERVTDYIRDFQENDRSANAAMSDVKGDRSLPPNKQNDPDMYVHIVERNKDGIIVRGAKAHNSMSPYAEHLIVLPTRAMTKEDVDYAVAFVTPADAPGIKLVTRSSRMMHKTPAEAPANHRFASSESLTIFDNVFVPWERVFLAGEWQYAGPMAGLFATFHRHSYCGCKPGTTDVLIGLAALVADYNGVEKASHIKSKLADMIVIAEMVYSCGLAGSMKGKKFPAGVMVPDPVLVNIGKFYAATNYTEEVAITSDIAGGLVVTMPDDANYRNADVKEIMHKYLKGRLGVSAEDRIKCFRLLEDLIGSEWGSFKIVGAVSGGGSPEAQRHAIVAGGKIKDKKNLAKKLAGIPLETNE